MVENARLICLIFAVVLFAIAAFLGFWTSGAPRFRPLAAGLFFYALKDLFPG